MARRPRRNVYQKTLPGFSPVPVAGKAVVIRTANARPDPAVQLPLPPASDYCRQHALTIAQAYTEHVKAILGALMPRIEAVAKDVEQSCPDSERVQELRAASAAVGHMLDKVAGIAWPHVSGREARPLRVMNRPSADRHPSENSSREVSIAGLQVELNSASGMLDRAVIGLSQFSDPQVGELTQELGEIKPATVMLPAVGAT